MHIAILSHEYPPFIYGGIGTFVKNLSSGLAKQGVQVTILSGYPRISKGFGTNIQLEPDERVTIKRFSYLNIPPCHTFFQLNNMKKIFQVVKELKPDLIHGQCGSTFPLILNLKRIAPVVTTFHSSAKTEKDISAYSLLRGGTLTDLRTYVLGYPVMSYVLKQEVLNSRLNIAVSNTLKSELIEEMGTKYREKICAIPNGVDLEALDKEVAALEISDDPEKYTIAYAGRLYWRKGPLNIVRLALLLKKQKARYRFVVHGTGPLFGKLTKDINALGLSNVDLRGFTSRKGLLTSIEQSKLVLIPSLYEACPMILLESMCLGKIPVMFDLPYSREFTDNGRYGILASNIKEMATKISQLSEDEIEYHSKEIRQFARKRYNIAETAKAYCSIYRKYA